VDWQEFCEIFGGGCNSWGGGSKERLERRISNPSYKKEQFHVSPQI
jgi:hypothetical protein